MKDLIWWLRRFNSKERFFLVGQVLGNPDFIPSAKFLEELSSVLGIKITGDIFSAMDFHLDWLHASLKIARDGQEGKVRANEAKLIEGNQEDVDFLIAFDDGLKTHLVMIEAKGVTGWTNKQMGSKTKRLIKFFGEDGNKWKDVIPYFLIMSPRKPEKLNTEKHPSWMLNDNGELYWIELNTPKNLLAATRCNQNGKRSEKGDFWTTINR